MERFIKCLKHSDSHGRTSPVGGLFGMLAGKVRRVVDAARSFVAGDFGPGAERTSAYGLRIHDACGRDRGRGLTFFHPMNQGRGAVESARPWFIGWKKVRP